MHHTTTVSTDRRTQTVDVTDEVRGLLPADASGIVHVSVAHTTCAVTVNEAEPRLLSDLVDALSELVSDSGWAHDELDDNADSHVRAMLVGPSETIPVVDGELQLGTWQSVLLVECDGPRTRTIRVAVSS